MQVETYHLSRPPVKITCVARLPPEIAERWIREHAAWLEESAGVCDSTRGGRIAVVPSWKRGALAKRDARSFSRGALSALLGRSSRSRNAFEVGLVLERAGVEAARPLALIEERRVGIVRRGCVVLELIDGVTLRDFILAKLPALGPGRAGDRLKEELWSALAAQIAKLHAVCVRQRDLKAVNIIVSDGKDGAPRAALIDLDGMEILSSPPSPRVRARDLARLAVSLREEAVVAAGVGAQDWRKLVASYLEAVNGAAPPRDEVERMVARTLAWALRKEARNRRRGRVIY